MEVERDDNDAWHFRLGPVERWIIIGGAALLVSALGYVFTTVTGTQVDQGAGLKKIGDTMSDMRTQMAVTNSQLSTLSNQMASLPDISRQLAEIKVQTERNTEDIHDIKTGRDVR